MQGLFTTRSFFRRCKYRAQKYFRLYSTGTAENCTAVYFENETA